MILKDNQRMCERLDGLTLLPPANSEEPNDCGRGLVCPTLEQLVAQALADLALSALEVGPHVN